MSLRRPQHAGMRHVALNVLNLPLVEAFYVELLGFEVEWRPDSDNVYLCSGVDNLALHVVADTGGKAQTLAHTGIIVDQIEQVDEWYAYLLENGFIVMTQKSQLYRSFTTPHYLPAREILTKSEVPLIQRAALIF